MTAPATSPATRLYVYAATRADAPPLRTPGLDGISAVETVVSDGVALLVCEVDANLFDGLDREPVTEDGRLARLARRHDEVVTAAFRAAPVLPLRFGTLLRDRDDAHCLVRDRAARLDAELDRLSGAAEFTVRALDVRTAATPEPDTSTPDPAQSSAERRGTAYLSRRRDVLSARERHEKAVVEALTRTHETLVGSTRDHLRGSARSAAEGVAWEIRYLVTAEDGDAFLTAVELRAAQVRDLGLELTVHGPWPPYSFAREALSPEAVDD